MPQKSLLLRAKIKMKNSFLLMIFAFHLQYLFCVSDDFSGFISIDCGSAKSSSYKGLQYSTDKGFIDSGENHNISPSYNADNTDQILNLRSFPVGERNCYNLSVAAVSEGKKYIIRAHFLYGNYDGKKEVPQFDLYLGVEKWDTITTANSGEYLWWEIIHVPKSNYVYVCLVNTGQGIPYISALEVRPMKAKAYTNDPLVSILSVQYLYFAPGSSNQVIRYPDDLYDRRWSPFPTSTEWKELKFKDNSIPSYFLPPPKPKVTDIYLPPPPQVVLQSAVTPKENDTNLLLNFDGLSNETTFSFCFHFCEVEVLGHDRESDLYLNGDKVRPNINIDAFRMLTSVYIKMNKIKTDFNFSLQKSAGNAYPPILNAVEMFKVTKFLQSQTDENDVFAMVNIKATYGLNKSNWQGDPCLPRDFLWEGLDCITFDNQITPPRIKYLDLSSSGVSGLITTYLSQLKSLEFLDLSRNNLSGQIPYFLAELPSLKVLDLSHNKLTGQIPDFLAELPSLKVLNLSGNNFIEPIPQKLTDKAHDGSLLLTLYDIDPSKKNGVWRKSLTKILTLSLAALLLSLGIALFIIFRKQIINPVGELLGIYKKSDVDMGDRSEKFTMAEIKKMTKKFKNPIGNGSFGQVFRGTMIDGTEVAVKLFSAESTHGHHQLEVEVKLLKRPSHQNLTRIFGYCDEGKEIAIVYKYMSNGSLNNFLSTDSKKVLTWRQRLSIAFGATQGLHYLHECNLIHGDVKPENILLDEKLEAKLGDYGLVREITENNSHVTTALQCTDGYVDPEYGINDRLGEKSDVYNMGVVLLRLITGKPLEVQVENEFKNITQWLKDVDVQDDKQMRAIVDPKLDGIFDLESVKKAFTLATKCAAPESESRPNMSEVVKGMEECLKLARGQMN